jgi:hypothetical protein
MPKKDVEKSVCSPYCSFYREGEKEELICNGARLLEILINRGALTPASLIAAEEGSALSLAEYDRLEEIICQTCPFMAEDCDFRSETPPPGAEPCGGFILLSFLVGKGALPMEWLKEIAVD